MRTMLSVWTAAAKRAPAARGGAVRTAATVGGERAAGDAVAAGGGAAAFAPPARPVVRRVGFLRGGLVGFLLGISSAGAAAYVYLLDEYQRSSMSLLAGVDSLQKSTEKFKLYSGKVESLEKDIKSAAKTYATKRETEDLRNELLRAIDEVHVAHLELKAEIWERGSGASVVPAAPTKITNAVPPTKSDASSKSASTPKAAAKSAAATHNA